MVRESIKRFRSGRELLEIADFSSIIGPNHGKGLSNGKAKDAIKQIKKATRRQFSADDKIRIVLEGLRGETVICRNLQKRRNSFGCLLQVVQSVF
ncbi:MAG: hypothetical protein DRI01_09190 [Chloroflexi bacterium]|nr:MAG: hypothetical protein DRI01_09190 [Chloroflexota bacterium]